MVRRSTSLKTLDQSTEGGTVESEGRKNYIDFGGKRISFSHPVMSHLIKDDRLVALLDWSDMKELSEIGSNVLCVNKNGDLLWKIEPFFTDRFSPYSSLWEENDGTIVAYNSCGVDCSVDVETGKTTLWASPDAAPGPWRPW